MGRGPTWGAVEISNVAKIKILPGISAIHLQEFLQITGKDIFRASSARAFKAPSIERF